MLYSDEYVFFLHFLYVILSTEITSFYSVLVCPEIPSTNHTYAQRNRELQRGLWCIIYYLYLLNKSKIFGMLKFLHHGWNICRPSQNNRSKTYKIDNLSCFKPLKKLICFSFHVKIIATVLHLSSLCHQRINGTVMLYHFFTLLGLQWYVLYQVATGSEKVHLWHKNAIRNKVYLHYTKHLVVYCKDSLVKKLSSHRYYSCTW